MARKQAKRRKKQRKKQIRLPRLPFAQIATVAGVAMAILTTFKMSSAMLDRPIHSIEINGPFQRVSALHIEEVISDELDVGFLSADLSEIQRKIVALPWIDHANVARRWPSKIAISITEQVPAAVWGERGLLNTRGELFVSNASHIPAELPRLRGPENAPVNSPDDLASLVAERYLAIREQLIPLGFDVRELQVDSRGAWDMTLQNGIDIRLGRHEVQKRTQLFLDIVANVVASREADVAFVDMRYNNGFTIGWKNGSRSPSDKPQEQDPAKETQEMVAGRMR